MVLVSASAGGIHGPGLVAVVLELVMKFLVMLMSRSVCSFWYVVRRSPSVSKACHSNRIGIWLVLWRELWSHVI